MKPVVQIIPAVKKEDQLSPDQKPVTRVAAYVRVSTLNSEQEESFESQKAHFENLIQQHPGWEMAEIYADQGISGLSTKKRKGFLKMMRDAKAHKFDILMVKSISRFCRNTIDSVSSLRELKRDGVDVHFEKEGIKTSEGSGEMLITIMSAFSQAESESISQNVQMGVRYRMARGEYRLAASRFLGYDQDEDGNLAINEDQAETVKMIYDWLLDGMSLAEIGKKLEAQNRETGAGKTTWSRPTLTRVIKNEKYMGDALLQKSYTVDVLTKQRCINNGDVTQYYVKDHHPAIIDRQTFYLAKGELLRRDAGFSDGKTPGPKIVPDKNDFTHKIICPICKRHYVRYSWGGAGEKAGWICSGRSLGECDGNILKEVELKKMMLEAFQKLWDKQPRVKQKRVPKLNAESSEDELINAAAIHMDNVFAKRVKEFLKSPRPTEYDPLLTKRLVDEITFTNDFNEQVYSVRFNDKTTITVATNCMKPRRGDGKGRKLRRR